MARDATPVAVTGSWWRHLPAGGDPAYRGPAPVSGRWQRGEVVAALYLAGDRDTVWAEWYRRLADDAIAPLDALPRDLWAFSVALDHGESGGATDSWARTYGAGAGRNIGEDPGPDPEPGVATEPASPPGRSRGVPR